MASSSCIQKPWDMSDRGKNTAVSLWPLLGWRRPRARDGDLTEVALSHAPELHGFALRLCDNKPEADDLLQETFVKALSKRTQLRERSAIRAWLFRIMRNIHIDRRKSAAYRLQILDGDIASHGEAKRVRGDLRLTLERALAQLPTEQRECILLATIWGFRYREIAAIVDCPVGTVRSRIARARAALTDLLEEVTQ